MAHLRSANAQGLQRMLNGVMSNILMTLINHACIAQARAAAGQEPTAQHAARQRDACAGAHHSAARRHGCSSRQGSSAARFARPSSAHKRCSLPSANVAASASERVHTFVCEHSTLNWAATGLFVVQQGAFQHWCPLCGLRSDPARQSLSTASLRMSC